MTITRDALDLNIQAPSLVQDPAPRLVAHLVAKTRDLLKPVHLRTSGLRSRVPPPHENLARLRDFVFELVQSNPPTHTHK